MALIQNSSGVYNPEKIVKELVSFWGLFDRILGKHFKKLVYSENIENSIQILDQFYWLHNSNKIFPTRIVKKEFDRVSETVFRIVKENEAE